MSGDGEGNYGGSGSGGWDLNSFGDWENMINTLGGGGSSTPGTQGSATPGGYQPPNFDLDAYVRPNVPRFSQGLSQIREDFPVNPTPGVGRGGGSGRGGGGGRGSVQPQTGEDEEEEEEEDLGRHPYNNLETMAVYNAWITVSYDPIVGNQQTRKCFWEKVVEVYHQIKPNRSRKRTVKMIRCHFDRVDRQVKKFCGIYSAEEARYQSGATATDILTSALRVYYQDEGHQFRFVDVWRAVKDEERWAGGFRSSSGSTSKRTKHTASGQYSSSAGASSGDTAEGISQHDAESQEFAGTVGDAGGSASGRRRPQGTKAAKAARARKGRGESSQSASGSGSRGGSDTLMVAYMTATMADTSRFSHSQFAAWWNGIVHMAAQLGLPTPPQPRPPPEDD